MSWFLIALSAQILLALVLVFDKFLVKNYSIGEKGSGGLALFTSFVGLISSAIILIFIKGIFDIPINDKLLLLGAGAIYFICIVLYLYTLEIEDISVVAPWFSTIPIFGYLLGYFALGEVLTKFQIIGSIIVLIGVLIVSIDFEIEEKNKFKWKPAFYIVLACLLFAISGLMFKYVTVEDNFWISSFWEYLGLGFAGILTFVFSPKFRKEFSYMNKQGGIKIFALNWFGEFFTIAGNMLTSYALLLAPLALVYVVGSLEPVIVLIFVVIGTNFFPHIITEKIHKQVLIPKIVAIAIIIVGSMFLFV